MPKPVALITTGDPAGIGPEVILKGLLSALSDKFVPVVLGHLKTYTDPRYYDLFTKINFRYQKGVGEETPFLKPTFLEPSEEIRPITIGRGSKSTGKAGGIYLDVAIEILKKGKADILITGPISKKHFKAAGYEYNGHTDYLKKRTNAKEVYMMFSSSELNLILATHHIPLSQVPKSITTQKLNALFSFIDKNSGVYGIKKPRIAVTGLNPHAGEDGILGKEEKMIIQPAILKAQQDLSLSIHGPFPADAIFRPELRKKYNLIVVMYHDQGLTAVKAIGPAVNVTIGLPFIRTSVDHGTAYDLAGVDKADPRSFIEALKKGLELHRHGKINQYPDKQDQEK